MNAPVSSDAVILAAQVYAQAVKEYETYITTHSNLLSLDTISERNRLSNAVYVADTRLMAEARKLAFPNG